MTDLIDNFSTNNLSDTRKLITDFYEQSPMFGVVATKVDKRRLELANGHWLGDFATQDYLSLDFEPEVINAAVEATKKYGTVVAWCRLVATVDLFTKVEKSVANLVGAEAAQMFASTTILNHGVIPALLGKDGVMFLDKSGHATLYEGGKIARDSGATLVSFKQDDFETLEKLLIEHRDNPKKLIVTDGVYSMTGEYANLPELDRLAKKYNALLYVDDAHGFGVVGEKPSPEQPYGHKGNGLVKYFDLSYENILYVACFSKAYGSYGAFVAGKKSILDFLFSQATPHDLGGHGSASAMAAVLKGLEINEQRGDEIRSKLYELTRQTKRGLFDLGFTMQGITDFPIISVWLGDSENIIAISQILFDNHVLLTLAPYPMVQRGEESLRVTVTPSNTQDEVKALHHAFSEVKKYLIVKKVWKGSH